MRMYDVIQSKKEGNALTEEEIRFLVQGFTKDDIPDYQMSAFTMAVYFNGMSKQETAWLTKYMAESGDLVDLSGVSGIKIDKHSTGGVGDKTTLVVAPIVSACGLKVAKMSGRGLGHTGGTVDKLESIPGFKTEMSQDQFINAVNEAGIAVVGQSGNLAPADKKLYALRDVTATVDSLPLIASSIMSKKIAAGADVILLDVKTGSGAFMKEQKDAIALAQSMVDIGNHVGRKTAALITNMDIPLGNAIGNAVEVAEAVATLKGEGPEDLMFVSKQLATNILWLGNKGTLDECAQQVETVISNGLAFKKLCQMVEAQKGDVSVIEDLSKFQQASIKVEVISERVGYIQHMDTEACGVTAVMLGAGRETKESPIDHSAGIILKKKTGDYVRKGETLATFLTNNADVIDAAKQHFEEGLVFSNEKPVTPCLVYGRVSEMGFEDLNQ